MSVISIPYTLERSSRPPLLLPLGVLAALTLLFRLSDLDLAITDTIYGGDPPLFRWQRAWFRAALNSATDVFTVVFLAGVLVVLAGARWSARLRSLAVAATFLGLAFLLSLGVLVNGLAKPGMSRPRPWEVERYGGPAPFARIGEVSDFRGRSFPSGDAAIGFFLGTPAFLVWRGRRGAAWSWVALGLAGGIGLGAVRVGAGAHWASDIVWSAGFVFLGAYLAWWIVSTERYRAYSRRFRSRSPEPASRAQGGT